MRRPLLGLLTCFLTASFISAGTAQAESGHQSKEVGNAPAAIDITAIYANNAQKRVRIKLVVPGLTHKGRFTLGYEGRYYDGMAIEVFHRDGRLTAQAWHCGEDSCAKVKCPRAKVHWNAAKHYVSASVPQSCYPFNVPKAWSFNGNSHLGNVYDSEYTNLKLRRG